METILETWSLPYHLMKSLLTVFKYELLMMMREIWVYFYGSYKYFSRCTPLISEWFSLSLALKDTINQISWESGQGLGYVFMALSLQRNVQFSSKFAVFLYFFALITEEGFLVSSCYSLELCIQMLISFLFSFAFSSLLFTASLQLK